MNDGRTREDVLRKLAVADLMRKAAKKGGMSDEQVLDAFFGSDEFSDRLIEGTPLTDDDYGMLLDLCQQIPWRRDIYSPGAFSYLITCIVLEVCRKTGARPSEVYFAFRGSEEYEYLSQVAAAFLHIDDQDEYRRVESAAEELWRRSKAIGPNPSPRHLSDTATTPIWRPVRVFGLAPSSRDLYMNQKRDRGT